MRSRAEKLRRDVALAVEVKYKSVGEDYYDCIRVVDQNIGITLADAAENGVSAVPNMSVVQASVRILSAEGNISFAPGWLTE
ncbi:MAG: hypothetical protein M3Y24_05180 [Acidobacteriota bacterium]|nr:hypothetical protein [Acidobacteriota bacterium]